MKLYWWHLHGFLHESYYPRATWEARQAADAALRNLAEGRATPTDADALEAVR